MDAIKMDAIELMGSIAHDDSRVAQTPVLELRDVEITYAVRAGGMKVIPRISFKLFSGEAIGLVGESGSGKSTVAFAIMQYLGTAGAITNGQILFQGKDLATLSKRELRAVRGRSISMVYQDPMSSLNPVLTIGQQLVEVPIVELGLSKTEAYRRAITMLKEVNLHEAEEIMERYPHQLSGGQQQRVVIAMALMTEPALLVMDEPTTGLDATVEAAVLDLVAQLRKKHNTALVFISHNLGTVAQVCDRIGVMYSGELVEEGPVLDVFKDARHPYTRSLLHCIPTMESDKKKRPLAGIPGQMPSPSGRPPGCSFAPRCSFAIEEVCSRAPIAQYAVGHNHTVKCARLPSFEPTIIDDEDEEYNPPLIEAQSEADVLTISHLKKVYRQSHGMFGKARDVLAIDDISLSLPRGATLAIVGESGSGKSTLAKVLTGLETSSSGEVILNGYELGSIPIDKRDDATRRNIQMIFQNPDSTLNPSHTIGYAIGRALRKLRKLSASETQREIESLLTRVNLPVELATRLPRQLSGGQKQRASIARALAGNPTLLIADEPVSALDVSVQAAIVNLLINIQGRETSSLVFISHDLAVVHYLADYIAVLYRGKLMEYGKTEDIFARPHHPYTEALISAIARPEPNVERNRIILETIDVTPSTTGCVFSAQCPRRIGDICDTQRPPIEMTTNGHQITCHIPLSDLKRIERDC